MREWQARQLRPDLRASTTEEAGAGNSRAGICGGGGRATALPAATPRASKAGRVNMLEYLLKGPTECTDEDPRGFEEMVLTGETRLSI